MHILYKISVAFYFGYDTISTYLLIIKGCDNMIYQNKRELAVAMDDVISKFMSLNLDITDTENEHSLFVFTLERKGYQLRALSPTRLVKNASIPMEDCFSIDEHLQDLHEYCCLRINKSKRYKVK
jgi:hypothetical protein